MPATLELDAGGELHNIYRSCFSLLAGRFGSLDWWTQCSDSCGRQHQAVRNVVEHLRMIMARRRIL